MIINYKNLAETTQIMRLVKYTNQDNELLVKKSFEVLDFFIYFRSEVLM